MSTQELFFLFLAAGAGFLGVRHLIQVLQARQGSRGDAAPTRPAAPTAASEPASPASGTAQERPAPQAGGTAGDSSQWFRRTAGDPPEQPTHPADATTDSGPAAGAQHAAAPGEQPWYRVLEVSPTAPMDDIRQAYKRKLRQYHPDKLAGLGPELLAVAEEKTKEINRAYAKALDGR